MHRYIIKRFLAMIPVLLGISFLIFAMLSLAPGDPARLSLGENAPESALAEFRKAQGLDKPLLMRYGIFVYRVLRYGDMGKSYTTKLSVMNSILTVFPTTLKLAIWASLISISIGIVFGVISAVKQNSFIDAFITIMAMIGLSMPIFWFGLLLILLFSVHLGWLPSSWSASWESIILPAASLGLQSVSRFTRMTRSTMLEVLRSDYVRTARSKGQSEGVVLFRHALGNALIPIITLAGMQFGGLLEGAVLTESIFSIPGVGRLLVEAIKMRDQPIILGCILFTTACFCVINLLVDILYAYVDPRIRAQYK